MICINNITIIKYTLNNIMNYNIKATFYRFMIDFKKNEWFVLIIFVLV